MAVYRCKMCGGELAFEPGSTIAVCEYCGTRQTVSSAGDEKRINLFNRANRLRMNSEFDRAATIYEQIIAEFPEEAEAYWGLCLCNYGIEYVDDPATGKKIPTCHRASFNLLRKDENYELALENADMSARLVYQEEAKEIDRIMGEILSVSKNESPYDVFICYKETDNNGNRTKDSVIAQDIYAALTEKGYKVFFSRITLEDKLGQQYEPYIFAALNSARVMLAIGTDYENFASVWVKNEWSRFLRLMAKDKSKILIPCYKDMDPYALPDEFKGLQAQDLNKLGYIQDLVRGIEKIVRPAHSGQNQPILESESLEKTILRAEELLRGKEWERAKALFDRAIQMDEKNEAAHLGILLADLKVTGIEMLSSLKKPFDGYSLLSYKQLMRYGSESTLTALEKANRAIRKNRRKLKNRIIALIAAIGICIVSVVLMVNVVIPNTRRKNTITRLAKAEEGDYVSFGLFEQDNDLSNGKEPIEWQILAKEGNSILVISKYALDCKPYNTTNKGVTWEKCSLRQWLNGSFLNEAFSESERAMISSVTVSADMNPSYNTSPGNSTTDQVFLLSITEVNRYFSSDSARQRQGTAYCYAQGAYKASNGNCRWWLRSPGGSPYGAACVSSGGGIDGAGVGSSNYAVCPALWIDLNP